MKRNLQIIILIAFLASALFFLVFYFYKKHPTQNTMGSSLSTQCLPDARMTPSIKWLTFTESDFSIDYPEVLIPNTQSRFINVFFRTKTNPFSNAPLGVDITAYPISTWNGSDRVSGIKSYQCIGGPSAYVNIFHGSKVYSISTIGMSLNDVKRMVNSIKFLE